MKFPKAMRAVVTGAGSGLGRAIALELAGRGARLLICDINEVGLSETVAQLQSTGAAEVQEQQTDVTDPEQVEALAVRSEELWGGVDLLVNNAGVAVGGSVGEVPLEGWRLVIDVNLWGVIHGCHAFVPRMKQSGRGWIINVASAAGLLSPPKAGPYNVTKAAVVALSETMAAELQQDGIHVTALCPSFFQTNIAATGQLLDAKDRDLIEQRMAASRVQAPDVARAAVRAVERGQLYAVPMLDAQSAWLLKRAAPGRFYDLVGRVFASLRL